MKIHVVAGREQYERHIHAVWKHLPDSWRGEFLTGPQATGNHLPPRDVVMVGGYPDVARCRQQLIYVEHGAGQGYSGDPKSRGRPGYHGAYLDERVRWFLSPRPDVARSWGPLRQAFVAGCPALDQFYRWPRSPMPRVAVLTFHWDARWLSPEAATALDHYREWLPEIVGHLRAQGFDPVGHWHPRSPTMRTVWRDVGIDVFPDVTDVLKSAHLLIADNTSVMYEAAALGIPVLALNCPRYRRTVHHGLRFWNYIPGFEIDGPEDLLALDVGAYVRDDWSQEIRERAVRYCYGGVEIGGAGKAAADWIVGQLS